MSKTEPTPEGCALVVAVFAASLAFQLALSVVVEGAWSRWAVTAGAPPVPLVAVVAVRMLWISWRIVPPRKPDDAGLGPVVVQIVSEFLMLALAAAIVWGAP